MGRLYTWLYTLDSASECGYSTCCTGSDNATFRVVLLKDTIWTLACNSSNISEYL